MYLQMCKDLGTEPKEEEIPPALSEFPQALQTIMCEVYPLLPDVWDTNSGFYCGKNMATAPYIIDATNIEEKVETLYMLKYIDGIARDLLNSKISADRAKKAAQASVSKSK